MTRSLLAGRIGGGLALLAAAVLMVMAWPFDPVVLAILGPSILSGFVTLLRPGDRWALAFAILLIATSAFLTIIAGAGLVYVPAVIALAYALLNSEPGSRTVSPVTTRPRGGSGS